MCLGSVKCIMKKDWSQDLTLSRLNSMMTIFKGRAWLKAEDKKKLFIPPRTYLFAPECPNLSTKGHVYMSQKRNGIVMHAEDYMVENCGLPDKFYLTSAPCPDCAIKLYSMYGKKNYKPTIYIGRPYQGKGKPGSQGNKRVNEDCLTMLEYAGFKIIPWDWHDFANTYITNNECKDALHEMTGDNKYEKRYAETRKVLTRITFPSFPRMKNYLEICLNATKKKKSVIPKKGEGKGKLCHSCKY